MKIFGSHNSLTAYSLLGWQRHFKWLIDPFCKCQDKVLYTQLCNGVRLFDFQIAKKGVNWYGSHGIAWYNIYPLNKLYTLNNWIEAHNEKVYIILGLDNHPFAEDSKEEFLNIIKNFSINYPNLTLVRAYIDKNYELIYEDKEFFKDVHERYWSKGWAKLMGKFWYYLSLPRYWRDKFYWKWFDEGQALGKKYLMSDFV